jgi:uncharacterized protein YjiS (DUF1127 family)
VPSDVTFLGVAAALARWMKEASARRRGRHALAAMSEAQLKDIGITRLQAELEASKPFWR